MVVPGPAYCFLLSPWAIALCLSVSSFCGHLSSGLVPGHGGNGVCSGLAKPGLRCQQSDCLHTGWSHRTGASTNRLYFNVPLYRLIQPQRRQQGMEKNGVSACRKQHEATRGSTGSADHLLSCHSVTSRKGQRRRSWKLHSPGVGRAVPQLQEPGLSRETNGAKRSPSCPRHRKSRQTTWKLRNAPTTSWWPRARAEEGGLTMQMT